MNFKGLAINKQKCHESQRKGEPDSKGLLLFNDYHEALEEIEKLMFAQRDTPEGDRLDVFSST